MNILFVNYGGPENNSMNHIAGFADSLGRSGHECLVAVVARAKLGAELWPKHRFRCVSYNAISRMPSLFADGRPADLVHAWTPRESVRKVVFAYFREALTAGARPALLIHLEDNEEAITARIAGCSLPELTGKGIADLPSWISHPLHYRNFLALADGVTVIIRPLGEFVPQGVPWEEVWPGLDPQFFEELGEGRRTEIRREVGLPEGARMVTYTGNASRVNRDDMIILYSAIRDLNDQGIPCRLVRTGLDDPSLGTLPFDPTPFLLNQGFVPAWRIPELIKAADVLLQPGAADEFNLYRLPSKIPEFLAAGRPVVMPAANVGLKIEHGRQAFVCQSGEVSELVANARRALTEDGLAASMGSAGREFARQHFDRETTSTKFAIFQQTTWEHALSRPRSGLRELLKPRTSGPLAEILRYDPPAEGDPKKRQKKRRGIVSISWDRLRRLWPQD